MSRRLVIFIVCAVSLQLLLVIKAVSHFRMPIPGGPPVTAPTQSFEGFPP